MPDSKRVAIIGLDGVERHWTVAHAATKRTLRVTDSCGLQVIFRAQCTAGRTSLRYQLRPADVLIVKCGKGQGSSSQLCRSSFRASLGAVEPTMGAA